MLTPRRQRTLGWMKRSAATRPRRTYTAAPISSMALFTANAFADESEAQAKAAHKAAFAPAPASGTGATLAQKRSMPAPPALLLSSAKDTAQPIQRDLKRLQQPPMSAGHALPSKGSVTDTLEAFSFVLNVADSDDDSYDTSDDHERERLRFMSAPALSPRSTTA